MEIELKGAGVQYYSTNFQFFVLKFEFKKISSLCWSKGLFVYILRGRGGSKLKINLISKPSCKNQKTFISYISGSAAEHTRWKLCCKSRVKVAEVFQYYKKAFIETLQFVSKRNMEDVDYWIWNISFECFMLKVTTFNNFNCKF